MRSLGLVSLVWVLLSVSHASAQQAAELVEEPDPVVRAAAWTEFWRTDRTNVLPWVAVGSATLVTGVSAFILADRNEGDWGALGIGVWGLGAGVSMLGTTLAIAAMGPIEHELEAPTDALSLARWEGQVDGFVRLSERRRWTQAAAGWVGCAAGAALLTWGILEERDVQSNLALGMGVMSMASDCTSAIVLSLGRTPLAIDYDDYQAGFSPPRPEAPSLTVSASPIAVPGGAGGAIVGSF